MQFTRFFGIAGVLILFAFILEGCRQSPAIVDSFQPASSLQPSVTPKVDQVIIPSATPELPAVLTICMAEEPDSLFIYADLSIAARTVQEAISDGPYETIQYKYQPVILEKTPSQAEGDIFFQAVSVSPGDLLVDAHLLLTNLAEGVEYFPVGCFSPDCVQTYSGQEPVQINRLVVRYKLRQGVQWSDGKSLTADDSLFSYEVARSLYPAVRQEILARTYQYQTLDSYTLEWQGVPGFWPSSALTYFFDPLPRHAWGEIPPEELLKSESVNYLPLSYGPYQIDNWLPGDSITFSRNPYYFRSGEGLPRFDQLVFRFVPQAEEAISLLEQGECDLLDETYHLEQHKELQEMVRNSAHSELVIKNNTAWEQITFGISPVSGVSPLSSREFRQAISQCIDRQRIVDTLFDGGAVLNQYIPPEHPLADPQANPAPFDTQGASLLLEELGWVDADGSPDTFRVSSGIAGIPDGQELVLTFLSDDDASSLVTAEILKESFAACGAKLESRALPVEQLLSPGPDGEIFGRKFQLAKFAWQSSVEPPCFLFTTAAIPGEYPRYPLGWGGGNAAGYSDPVFDFQCSLVLSILPDENQSLELSHQLQDLIEQDLPFLPLYSHVQLLAKRSEICGLRPDPSAPSSFWNLEELERNPQCEPTP